MKIKDIFVSHLLYPLISLLLVTIMLIMNKKNNFLSNRALIVFILVSSLIVALPGIATLAGLSFMPTFYLITQCVFVLLGYFYMEKIFDYFSGSNEIMNKFMIVLTTLCILTLGSYLFSLIFNYLGDFDYGLWASTCTYTLILPMLFKWSHTALLNIPAEIYKIWKYDLNYVDPLFTSETSEKIVVLKVELSKHPEDTEYIKVKARAPHSFTFGDWFQMFIHDYNIKYHESPICFQQENGEMYGWIFYTTPSLVQGKRYIDFEKTIAENGLAEDDAQSVICKRVDNIQY